MLMKKFIGMMMGSRSLMLMIILVVFSIVVAIIEPSFLSMGGLQAILNGLAVEGTIVIGMALLLISGEMDLSVGAIYAFTGVATGLLLLAGVPVVIAVILGILIAMFAGFINGTLVAKLGLNSFITTLGMSTALFGLMRILAKGAAVLNLPPAFSAIARSKLFGFPIPVYIMIVLVLTFHFLVKKNKLFRQSYYVGGNRKAAELNGINAKKVILTNYIIMGAIAGFVGILTASRFGTASITLGSATALNTITAAIIGGASLKGGKGTIFGAFLGALFMQFLASALNMLGINTHYQSFITGVILIFAIYADVLNERREKNLK